MAMINFGQNSKRRNVCVTGEIGDASSKDLLKSSRLFMFDVLSSPKLSIVKTKSKKFGNRGSDPYFGVPPPG
jgi:hypothetical protein